MAYLSSVATASTHRTTPDDDEDGGIPFRARANHIHRTWAGTFSSLPELYIQPESVAEVEKVVALARRRRRRIVTVGCGHSPSSITCSSNWMVNLDKLAAVVDVKASEQLVVVQAGIRLHVLGEELHRHGLALPNLGSIDQQSLAGALATGTHGSSLSHGLLSEAVVALRITLADGVTRRCSAAEGEDVDLFRAALLSLGALGIVVEITLRAVPAFTLAWRQTIDADKLLLETWSRGLWAQSEFVRAWWFPYTRRAVVWSADKTSTAGTATAMEADELDKEQPRPMCCGPPVSYYERLSLGYHVYHNLLLLAQLVPRMLPWVEWFVFGMQYGFANGTSTAAVQPGRDALLMNCLYSQFVNEWAIPLHRGPEALRRLGAWLNRLPPDHPDYVAHKIPFSAEGLYVHAPVEVRVSDTSISTLASLSGTDAARVTDVRPWLDPTVDDGPTLFLNATLYRPYHFDPPCRARYYEAFEWLMRDLGGRPHWAKNFTVRHRELEAMYGDRLVQFRHVRHRADPDGMFAGPWHRECILSDGPKLELEEMETSREPASGGGLRVSGHV